MTSGSRESVKSLEDNFRFRSSSFRDELMKKPAKQIYRKPQPVEEVENVAEDLVKSLNDPQVVSLKPRKPVKGKKKQKGDVMPKEHIHVPLSEVPKKKEEVKEEASGEGVLEEGKSPRRIQLEISDAAEKQSLLSGSTERRVSNNHYINDI